MCNILMDALVTVNILFVNHALTVSCAPSDNDYGLSGGWLLLTSPKVMVMSLCRRATDKAMLCIFLHR